MEIITETLGKSGANPENEEYDTHPPLINQQDIRDTELLPVSS